MSDQDLAVRPNAASAPVRTSSGLFDPASVPGWGIDADPDNDPTYSYRDRSNDDHSGQWARPAQQQSDVELLQSVEHKQTPAVFGTSSPPRYLSGWMRRAAFRWSESNWAHWMLLMGADRVNMVEGLAEDLARLKVPNLSKEMGLKARGRHDKKGVLTAVGVAAAIGGGIYAWSRLRNGGDEAEPAGGEEAQSEPRRAPSTSTSSTRCI